MGNDVGSQWYLRCHWWYDWMYIHGCVLAPYLLDLFFINTVGVLNKIWIFFRRCCIEKNQHHKSGLATRGACTTHPISTDNLAQMAMIKLTSAHSHSHPQLHNRQKKCVGWVGQRVLPKSKYMYVHMQDSYLKLVIQAQRLSQFEPQSLKR